MTNVRRATQIKYSSIQHGVQIKARKSSTYSPHTIHTQINACQFTSSSRKSLQIRKMLSKALFWAFMSLCFSCPSELVVMKSLKNGNSQWQSYPFFYGHLIRDMENIKERGADTERHYGEDQTENQKKKQAGKSLPLIVSKKSLHPLCKLGNSILCDFHGILDKWTLVFEQTSANSEWLMIQLIHLSTQTTERTSLDQEHFIYLHNSTWENPFSHLPKRITRHIALLLSTFFSARKGQ